MNYQELSNLYDKNKEIYGEAIGTGDKGTIHSYIKCVYTPLFTNRQSDEINLLEIGVGYGYSLLLWENYFINANKIIGVDINIKQIKFDFIKSQIINCNATSQDFLNLIDNINFDIIIDDGSHNAKDQKESFNLLYSKLNKNGLYIIEDVNNSDSLFDFFKSKNIPYYFYDGRNFKTRNDDCAFIIYKYE